VAKRILVIGDTIIDETVDTTALGLSLESPTLKVSYDETKKELGGAGNIAKNLVKMGCDVTFITTGKVELNGANVISLSGTPHKKTRYWVEHGDSKYKVLQVNHKESKRSETDDHVFSMIDIHYDCIILSDYRKGTLSTSLIKKIIESGKFGEIVSMSQVSDLGYDYSIFSGSSFVILNRKEYEACGLDNIPCIVTCGESGCFYVDGDVTINKEGICVNSVDTTGAGDCFVSAFSASSGKLEDRLDIANEYAAKSTTVHGTQLQ
tara:strand:+ start:83 stop:874 length:792 start_codon:yes stop_codon:yes gene_type:complete